MRDQHAIVRDRRPVNAPGDGADEKSAHDGDENLTTIGGTLHDSDLLSRPEKRREAFPKVHYKDKAAECPRAWRIEGLSHSV